MSITQAGTRDLPIYDSQLRRNAARSAIADLYSYRALVHLLVARELTVRYKRSVLGITWTVLNPLLTTLIMWIVFNHVFRSRIPGHIPYIVYILSGILAVSYFQQGIAMTAASLTASSGILTKVYVPPIVFAFSTACSGAVNFAIGLIPLFAFQLILHSGIAWTAIALPIPLLFLLAMIAGVGLFLATFAVRFDDILNLVNVLLLLVAYLTPIFYPITIIPATFRKYFYINPMYSYVNIFRFLDYGGPRPSWVSVLIVALSGVGALIIGAAVFVKRWPLVAAML